jgi:gamma-glutamyltranspeptidase/glutathione hydrolase
MARDRYPQHRGVVMARGGMIASAHPLVTATGLRALRAGGTAADAAIAAAAVCGVTLCGSNSIGGDMFCLYYDASTRRITGFNGNGAAGSGGTVAELRRRGLRVMPQRGPETVTVPGAVHGYWEVHSRFGVLPWAGLFEDAIRYAEQGHPVHERVADSIATGVREVGHEAPWAAIYAPGGRAPRAGEILVQPDYARSLRQVAEGGRDAYYQGDLGRRIVAYVQERGGFLTEADLATHATEVYEPISTTYRGLTIHETKPPSQGYLLLQMLNMLEQENLRDLGFNSAATIHRMVEAKKLAFADRLAYMGDPRFVAAPTAELIGKAYAQERWRAFDPAHAASQVPAGMPGAVPADTTSFVVADGQGNAASFIHTLYSGFGSGVTVPGTGIVLTNRGYGFAIDDDHPNRIEPGKRTMHTLNAYMGTDGDELVLVGNTPGGDNQVQWNAQVLTNLLDFDMNVQQAIEAPHWISTPGTPQDSWERPYELQLEAGIEREVAAELEQLGHRVSYASGFGAHQLIRRDPATGVLHGGSDPRPDGMAAGF